MTTSRHRWLAHLLPSLGFCLIATGALQIIASPEPASAAPSVTQAWQAAPQAAAKGGGNSVSKTQCGHDHARSAVASIIRERPKPLKKGDPAIKIGGKTPMFARSPRISIPKRSSQ